VTKTIEVAMAKNEPKYKNILNHQGNKKDIDFESSVWILFLFKLELVFLISFTSLVDFDQTLLVRLKNWINTKTGTYDTMFVRQPINIFGQNLSLSSINLNFFDYFFLFTCSKVMSINPIFKILVDPSSLDDV
jgi:hypothetical protein